MEGWSGGGVCEGSMDRRREGSGGRGETEGAGVGGVEGEVRESSGKSRRGGNQSRVTVGLGGPLMIAAGVPVTATISVGHGSVGCVLVAIVVLEETKVKVEELQYDMVGQ